jgi:putative IMPACT (imprinted ancient) family translation regulator
LLTIEQAGTAEQTINKSRFNAYAAHCESEQQVGAFLRAIAAQHPGAHHLAYAFRIKTPDGLGNHMIVPRFSDAGEPSGTAGKPVLQMLEGRDLINVAVGIIRYYGGINLGTGGLARAYSGINYKRVDELTRLVTQLKGKVLDKTFAQEVQVQVSLPAIEAQAFLDRFNTL